jgi:hypothetical protein
MTIMPPINGIHLTHGDVARRAILDEAGVTRVIGRLNLSAIRIELKHDYQTPLYMPH